MSEIHDDSLEGSITTIPKSVIKEKQKPHFIEGIEYRFYDVCYSMFCYKQIYVLLLFKKQNKRFF